MPVSVRSGTKVWQRRDRNTQLAVWFGWLVATALVVLSWEVISERTMWMFVEDAHIQAADLLGRMVPPRWSYMDRLWQPLWDTLNIATLGTLIAIVLGVPLAFLAARNTTPSVLFVRPLALLVIVASRSINSLIWALLLVSIIGPGVLAGSSRSRCARSASSASCSTRRSRRSTRAQWRRSSRPGRRGPR